MQLGERDVRRLRNVTRQNTRADNCAVKNELKILFSSYLNNFSAVGS